MTESKIEVSTIKPDVSFYHNDNFLRIMNIDDESKLDNHIVSIKNYMI